MIINNDISFEIKIRSIYDSLNPSEKTVADYVLENPSKILEYKLLTFAKVSGVSEATIMRFCKHLGYSGYSEMKLMMAKSLGEKDHVGQNKQFDIEISPNDKVEDLPAKIGAHLVKAIEDTLKILDKDELVKAVDAVTRCNRFYFVGVGTSASTAYDAFSKFVKLGISCFHNNDTHMQLIALSNAQPGDLVLAVSHSGKTKDTIEMAKLAKSRNATVMCLTNHNASLITKYSDIKLLTACYETGFESETMISRILQLSLIDMLYLGVVLQDFDLNSQYIENTNIALEGRSYK